METRINTGCGPTLAGVDAKVFRFEMGSRSIMLVGEVTAHQGYDG